MTPKTNPFGVPDFTPVPSPRGNGRVKCSANSEYGSCVYYLGSYFNSFLGCNECGPGEGAHEVDAYADCRINKRRRISPADAVNLVNWFETTPRVVNAPGNGLVCQNNRSRLTWSAP